MRKTIESYTTKKLNDNSDDTITKHESLLSLLLHNRDIALIILLFLKRSELPNLSNVSISISLSTQSEFIWEQLWRMHYGDFWRHKCITEIRKRRNILWDPYNNWGPPSQGWKLFYLEFEYGSVMCAIDINLYPYVLILIVCRLYELASCWMQ